MKEQEPKDTGRSIEATVKNHNPIVLHAIATAKLVGEVFRHPLTHSEVIIDYDKGTVRVERVGRD